MNTDLFTWVVLPFLIFLARICDVTIGTLRLMMIARGRKFIVPLLGFVEMLIWLLAVRQAVVNLANWACYFAFALGFAAGNFVGIHIEEKLAMGIQVIRIITHNAEELIRSLRESGFGVTVVDAFGAKDKVNIIFTIVKRSDQPKVVNLIQKFNPEAFYSIEDVRMVGKGIFPVKRRPAA